MAKETPFIGQMDRVVEVYKVTTVPNELSEHKETPVLVSKPYAKRNDTGGSQEVEGVVLSVVNRSYIIWRNAEIAVNGLAMYLVDGGVKFAIHSIREIGRSHLELSVKAFE